MNNVTFEEKLEQILPEIRQRKEISLSNRDVLIHAPGFEDRTMTVATDLSASGKVHAVLLDFRPYNEENRLSDVSEALLTSGFVIEEENLIVYDRFSPEAFEGQLQRRLQSITAESALIDISTMSKLQIILVLKVCAEMGLNVRILYTEAENYGPSEEEFNNAREADEIRRPSLQVYSGIHGVIRVKSLSSIAMQGQTTAALVFMSFNDALTQVLLNSIYPGRLFLINGRPPQHSWREEATAWIHEQVRQEWHEDNPIKQKEGCSEPLPERVVSTLDYRETIHMLIRLYWQLSAEHRILLAPAGSKMQAVGSYFVKALHPDIHIEYPSPEGFYSSYSNGVGAKWMIDLGNLASLLEDIAKVERQHFLELNV